MNILFSSLEHSFSYVLNFLKELPEASHYAIRK